MIAFERHFSFFFLSDSICNSAQRAPLLDFLPSSYRRIFSREIFHRSQWQIYDEFPFFMRGLYVNWMSIYIFSNYRLSSMLLWRTMSGFEGKFYATWVTGCVTKENWATDRKEKEIKYFCRYAIASPNSEQMCDGIRSMPRFLLVANLLFLHRNAINFYYFSIDWFADFLRLSLSEFKVKGGFGLLLLLLLAQKVKNEKKALIDCRRL